MDRKFEYKVIKDDLSEAELDELGLSFWELVTVVQPRVSVTPCFYFKRKLIE